MYRVTLAGNIKNPNSTRCVSAAMLSTTTDKYDPGISGTAGRSQLRVSREVPKVSSASETSRARASAYPRRIKIPRITCKKTLAIVRAFPRAKLSKYHDAVNYMVRRIAIIMLAHAAIFTAHGT